MRKKCIRQGWEVGYQVGLGLQPGPERGETRGQKPRLGEEQNKVYVECADQAWRRAETVRWRFVRGGLCEV